MTRPKNMTTAPSSSPNKHNNNNYGKKSPAVIGLTVVLVFLILMLVARSQEVKMVRLISASTSSTTSPCDCTHSSSSSPSLLPHNDTSFATNENNDENNILAIKVVEELRAERQKVLQQQQQMQQQLQQLQQLQQMQEQLLMQQQQQLQETQQQPPPPPLPPPPPPPPQQHQQLHVDYHSNHFDFSSWCPNTNCTGTTICYPCQRRWLIIITNGRSGSTTLKEMANHLPGVRLSGENLNLAELFGNHVMGTLERFNFWQKGKAAAWSHNPVPYESWSCAAQTVFTTAIPPKLDQHGNLLDGVSDRETILGFKTIRLFDDMKQKSDQPPTPAYVATKVNLMNRLFPCARFVVNIRSDTDSHAASWKRSFGNKTFVDDFIGFAMEALQMFHQQMGPHRSFLLDSTEWTQNITSFNNMVDWLGFSKDCHFERALEFNTKGVLSNDNNGVAFGPNCALQYNS